MNLTDPIFHGPDVGCEHLEMLQWADGWVCPHCGPVGNSTAVKRKSTRPGVYKCKGCRNPFRDRRHRVRALPYPLNR